MSARNINWRWKFSVSLTSGLDHLEALRVIGEHIERKREEEKEKRVMEAIQVGPFSKSDEKWCERVGQISLRLCLCTHSSLD